MREGYIKVETRTLHKIFNKKFIAATAALLIALITVSPLASAATYQTQINQLKQQNATTNAQKQGLAVEAADISQRIAGIQAEISAIEAQIAQNQARHTQVLAEIAAAEAELAKQKAILGENVKQMYLENELSTIEMMATSKSFGEFVDREQYRTSVQDKITSTMNRIAELKKQLDQQKAEVERILADQQAMQGRLAQQRAEANHLLSLNQQQQAELNSSMAANSAKISQLRRQQAAENARYNVGRVVKGGTGSYPWASVPFPNEMPDPWGMYKRQCVSYTAWKVADTGRYMPYWGGRGNAKNWDDNARAAGIPTDYSPRAGDVAISNSGTYGHAMYVEQVHSDGTITISQYNAGWDGAYSVVRRSVTGLVFIHF